MLKAIIFLTFFCFIKHIEGNYYDFPYNDDSIEMTTVIPVTKQSENEEALKRKELGYNYHPEMRGWLKLNTELVDWHTATMMCHDEDAILAAPWDWEAQSAIQKTFFSTEGAISHAAGLYLGTHATYLQEIYKYENGKWKISQDPITLTPKENCGAYYPDKSDVTWVDCKLRMNFMCYAPSASVCGDDDLEYNMDARTGKCYKFHAISKAWNDAYKTCQAEGAHLAIINSDIEAQVLKDLFQKYPYEKLNGTNPAWGVMAVGFYYWKQADKYVTIYGQTLEKAGYSRWSGGNPSSRGKSKELGGGMFRSGLLDDVDKSYKVPFVCEKKPIQLKQGY